MRSILRFRREDDVRLNPEALLILAGPIAIFLFGDLLFGGLGASQNVSPPEFPAWADVQRAEASHRALVLTGFLLVVSTSAMTVLMFAADLIRLFGPQARRLLLIGFAPAMATIFLSVVIFTGVTGFVPPTREYLGGAFVEEVLDNWGRNLFELLNGLLLAVQICMLISVPAVILGAISCLAAPASNLPSGTRQSLRDHQQRRLQRYLRLSALMLTAGLLFMMAWMRWPVFALPAGESEAFLEQVNAVSLYFGVNFSLVIIAYYVPVAALLQARQGELAEDDEDGEDAVYGPLFTKILTVAAPALVGAAAPLIDLFADG